MASLPASGESGLATFGAHRSTIGRSPAPRAELIGLPVVTMFGDISPGWILVK
jgi:hypothetical protein